MSRYQNIERSAFRHGQYVGYGGGVVWRISRHWKGWQAWPQPGSIACPIYGRLLRDISQTLEAL